MVKKYRFRRKDRGTKAIKWYYCVTKKMMTASETPTGDMMDISNEFNRYMAHLFEDSAMLTGTRD
jgi:hypothetical protein